jgi:hypothetical protein
MSVATKNLDCGALCEMKDAGGTFALYLPRPDCSVSRVRGHFSLAMAREWVDTVDPLFATGRRFHTLHDWEAMTSYDPDARKLLTKWIVQRRGLVRSARFITGSPLVALGIATAGLGAAIAGLELRVCSRREFDRVLAEMLAGDPLDRAS